MFYSSHVPVFFSSGELIKVNLFIVSLVKEKQYCHGMCRSWTRTFWLMFQSL